MQTVVYISYVVANYQIQINMVEIYNFISYPQLLEPSQFDECVIRVFFT